MKLKNAFRVTENTDAMLAFWDCDLVCRFANSAYLKWFGYTAKEMINTITLPQLLGPVFEKNLPYIKNALNGKVQVFERDLKLVNGEVRSTLATYSPEIKDGKVAGFYVHVVDVTFLKQLTFDGGNPASVEKSSDKDIRLNKVENSIRSSLFLEFPGIEKLAKENFISVTKLKKDFKNRYGTTIFSYYRKLQMEIADKYLREKIYTKKQVASMLGFVNQSNFLACYRKYYGKNFHEISSHDQLSDSSERYLINFISQAPSSIAIFDTNLKLLGASQKWKDDFLIKNSAIEGLTFYDQFPKSSARWRKLFNRGLKGEMINQEGLVHLKNGNKAWLQLTIKPWLGSDLKISGLIISSNNITSLKEKLLGLTDEVHGLTKILSDLNIGLWERNFVTMKTKYNSKARDIFEVPSHFKPDQTPAFNFYKKGRNRELAKSAFHNAYTQGKNFDIKVKIITALNNEKTVRFTGNSEFEGGICRRIYGIIQEI